MGAVRECIFCAGKKLNREDLWPVWVVKSVARDRSSEIERTCGRNPPVTYGGTYLKARCVCERCNGGWMSRLEGSAKPILEPMIHDLPCAIDYVQQSVIAAWTIKTAMVFECTKAESAFYSPEDRRHLLTWLTPPPDAFVWIGRYVNSHALFIENHYLSNTKPTNVLTEGCVTTFAIGRLCLQSFTARRSLQSEGKRITVHTKREQWDRLLIQVWPALEQVIRWPPPLNFGPPIESLEKLAGRIGGRG
jgi:hypothetical protein